MKNKRRDGETLFYVWKRGSKWVKKKEEEREAMKKEEIGFLLPLL